MYCDDANKVETVRSKVIKVAAELGISRVQAYYLQNNDTKKTVKIKSKDLRLHNEMINQNFTLKNKLIDLEESVFIGENDHEMADAMGFNYKESRGFFKSETVEMLGKYLKDVFGEDFKDPKKKHGKADILSTRKENPVNEFEDNPEIYLGAFPLLFFRGKFIEERGTLPKKYITHLLEWCDGRFFNDERFVFFLADQVRRHAVAFVSKAYFKDNRHTMGLIDIIDNPNWEKLLDDRMADSKSHETRELYKKISGAMKTLSNRIPFASNSDSISKMYSMQFAAGSPYIFLTIAPSDIHNKLGLRLALHDPMKDPLSDDGKRFDFFSPHINAQYQLDQMDEDKRKQMFELIKNNKTLYECEIDLDSKEFSHIDKDLSNENLYKLMTKNAGNTSIAFKMLIESMFENLIGVLPTHKTRCNIPPRKGIFGNITAWQCVIENQAKGTLHAHMVLYGGLTSHVIESLAEYQELRESMIKVTDSHVTAEVSIEDVYERHGKEEREKIEKVTIPFKTLKLGNALLMTENELESYCTYLSREASYNATWLNYHGHSFTCHKGKWGRVCCRLAYPQCCRECTSIFQLKVAEREMEVDDTNAEFLLNADEPTPKKIEKKRIVVENDIEPFPSRSPESVFKDPFNKCNVGRIIYYEQKRPTMNKDFLRKIQQICDLEKIEVKLILNH